MNRSIVVLCFVMALVGVVTGVAEAATATASRGNCVPPCCQAYETATGRLVEYFCAYEEVVCAVAVGVNCYLNEAGGEVVDHCTCAQQIVYGNPEGMCLYPRHKQTLICDDAWNENEVCTTTYDNVVHALLMQAEANIWECLNGLSTNYNCYLNTSVTRIE